MTCHRNILNRVNFAFGIIKTDVKSTQFVQNKRPPMETNTLLGIEKETITPDPHPPQSHKEDAMQRDKNDQ